MSYFANELWPSRNEEEPEDTAIPTHRCVLCGLLFMLTKHDEACPLCGAPQSEIEYLCETSKTKWPSEPPQRRRHERPGT